MTMLLIVHGVVQGVNYRQSTLSKAMELGVVGNVSNLPDGTVKIIAKGMPEQIDKLIEWCRVGPKHAKVINVSCHEIDDKPFDSFVVLREHD
ncbi:MAG: acylphosphatase [Chitinophagaceae bacterium]|nr:acylphosphatase [Chitinophagaceae bacterium]